MTEKSTRTRRIIGQRSRVTMPTVFSASSLHQVLAYIHYVARKERWKEVPLDFSNSVTVLESAMLPLIPILNRHMVEVGTRFELIPPKSEPLRRLFVRSNWAHFIDPFNHQYAEDASGTHCPVIRYTNEDEQFAAVDKVLSIILNSTGVSQDAFDAIEWSVNEITDNVLNHAGKDVSGFVQATWFRDNQIVEFVVADAGMGIPVSLGEHDQCLALEKAIQEGVTRNKETNQGNGLFGSFRIAQIAGGAFSLISQHATLKLLPKGEVQIRPSKSPYTGTAVSWNMRTDKSDVLSQALVFKGRRHELLHNFVDRLSDDAGQIRVSLKAAFPSLGSRRAGARVHTYLSNLTASARITTVEVDFEGINIISSSFADEVFGKLFVELGPMSFMSKVKIVNAASPILGLIDRAIVQRSSTSLGNA